MSSEKRIISIDIARIIAALLVVSIHVSVFYEFSSFNFFLNNIIARLAVPFFFVVSGYFAAIKLRGPDGNSYIWEYVKKIFFVYAAWSIVYFPFDFITIFEIYQKIDTAILTYIKRSIFMGSHYYLWFFTAQISSAVIFYFFYKYGKLRYLFFILPFLYIIGLLGDSYYYAIKDNAFWLQIYRIIDFWGTTKNGLFFGLPLFSLGYLAEKYNSSIGREKVVCLLIGSFSFYALEWVFLADKLTLEKYSFNIFLAPTIFFLFLWLIKLDINGKNMFIPHARDISLLIYCGHGIFLLFLKYFLIQNHIDHAGQMLALFAVFLPSFALALAIIYFKRSYNLLINLKPGASPDFPSRHREWRHDI